MGTNVILQIRGRGQESYPRPRPEIDRGFNFEYHPRPIGDIFRKKNHSIRGRGVGSTSGWVQIAIPSCASGIVSCLRSFQCPQMSDWYSFHINCGGKEVTLDGNTKYEADTDSGGPSRFFSSGTNWAFSSTGYFLDTSSSDFFICTNTSRLSMKDSDLYVDARLSPISLTYYGFCLLNGSYTVNLHFAEIMFTDDKTYSSLGRRIFDVYIQVDFCNILLTISVERFSLVLFLSFFLVFFFLRRGGFCCYL